MRGRWRAPAKAANGNAKHEAPCVRSFASRGDAVLLIHRNDRDRTEKLLARFAVRPVQYRASQWREGARAASRFPDCLSERANRPSLEKRGCASFDGCVPDHGRRNHPYSIALEREIGAGGLLGGPAVRRLVSRFSGQCDPAAPAEHPGLRREAPATASGCLASPSSAQPNRHRPPRFAGRGRVLRGRRPGFSVHQRQSPERARQCVPPFQGFVVFSMQNPGRRSFLACPGLACEGPLAPRSLAIHITVKAAKGSNLNRANADFILRSESGRPVSAQTGCGRGWGRGLAQPCGDAGGHLRRNAGMKRHDREATAVAAFAAEAGNAPGGAAQSSEAV